MIAQMVDNIQKAYINSTADLYTDFEWKVGGLLAMKTSLQFLSTAVLFY